MEDSNNDAALATEFRQALNDQDHAKRMMTTMTTMPEAEKREMLEKANSRLVAAVRAICLP